MFTNKIVKIHDEHPNYHQLNKKLLKIKYFQFRTTYTTVSSVSRGRKDSRIFFMDNFLIKNLANLILCFLMSHNFQLKKLNIVNINPKTVATFFY